MEAKMKEETHEGIRFHRRLFREKVGYGSMNIVELYIEGQEEPVYCRKFPPISTGGDPTQMVDRAFSDFVGN